MRQIIAIMALAAATAAAAEDPPSPGSFGAAGFPKPYSPPCVERENVFEFAEKPKVKSLGNDKYEITFAAKGNCDVTAGVVDEKGVVVRHLGSGVLGSNAPLPFQKNSLKQTIFWDGKNDLDVYHKTPEKLKVRVMLGLKPEFDRLMLGMSPKNLPGDVWGMAIGPDGAYVFSTRSHVSLRRFDHDGNYVQSLVPPPANLPMEKLPGMGFVEYEKGVRALHAPGVQQSVAIRGYVLPVGNIEPNSTVACQPVLAGNRVYYAGKKGANVYGGNMMLHYHPLDGTTDAAGLAGKLIVGGQGKPPQIYLAASPDGKSVYATAPDLGFGHAVLTMPTESKEPGKTFVGDGKAPGSDDMHFNTPHGVDCDPAGRVYVCDHANNRIQVFAPDAKLLKTIPISRPVVVQVHRKTGAIYVLHWARHEGQSVSRVIKLRSFDAPAEEFSADGFGARSLAVDSWTAKPRLWFGHGVSKWNPDGRHSYFSVRIYEEDGKSIKLLSDFDEEAKKEEGKNYIGRWGGGGEDRSGFVTCDALREHAYFQLGRIFDLRTGEPIGGVSYPGSTDDIAFDKRGYMHAHFNPGFYMPGVGRFNPEAEPLQGPRREVPYDYGEEARGLLGILPLRDQPGAKFFQDGVGVNMRGEVAENCNIYYLPKMEEEGYSKYVEGMDERGRREGKEGDMSYEKFYAKIQDKLRRGEEVYSIRRTPGAPLLGGTVWTFEASGELMQECAVTAGDLINGVQIDEDGAVYLVNARPRMFGPNSIFLGGRGGTIGDAKARIHPFTGTLIKTKPRAKCMVITASAKIPLEPLPDRPPELLGVDFMEEEYFNKGHWGWIQGAEWLYAGASPIVSGGCSCPTQRLHTDWYKRTFVPEAYRQSFGVLDTAGNLIMHLGRYGNYDSGFGPKSKVPIGGDNIAMFMPRFISGTDNYLCFSDWGERLVVLKLNYHAEESVGIQ